MKYILLVAAVLGIAALTGSLSIPQVKTQTVNYITCDSTWCTYPWN